ncbi:tetratricopeptide repeat protein [Cohnella yongneupensis]|uniref:Tetratricopeptide repeat protein n=1 Tax=Cohnella yongneupensis TaxID=425006 RepID=A0ABW0R037_9BACL
MANNKKKHPNKEHLNKERPNKPYLDTDPIDDKLNTAILAHNEGVAGSKDAVARAHALFQSLRSQYPKNLTVKAYSGSVLALMARDESNPFDRLDLAKQGLELLDEAVTDEPSNLTFRMLRGKISYRLPEPFFHRTETAIEDYVMLIHSEMRKPGTLEQKTYETLIYELGDAYQRTERPKQAQVCWNKLQKLTNDSRLLDQVNEKQQTVKAASAPKGNQPLKARDFASLAVGLVGASLMGFALRK